MAKTGSDSKISDTPPEAFYDLPPESFWVSTADEQDWFNRYAVMQRKTSLKLGFNRNTKSLNHRSDAASNRSKPSRSLRPSVLGLPKARKSFGADKNTPDKKSSRPLFRSRSEPGSKPPASEPGSPRVSCTGRIGMKARTSDGKRTGFSKLLGSLFGSGSGKNLHRKGGNGAVR